MGDEIAIPDDHRAAVKMLPLAQKPFGDACAMDRKVQSVMFHHDVPKDAMKKFTDAVGTSLVSLRMADPDTSDGKSLFEKAVKDMNVGAAHKLKLAIRRLGKEEPFVALVKRAPPPEKNKGDMKRVKSSSKSGDGPGSSADASSAAASTKDGDKDNYEVVSDGDLDDKDLDDNDDDDDEDGDEKATSGGVRCLNQLFSRVANDVSAVVDVLCDRVFTCVAWHCVELLF